MAQRIVLGVEIDTKAAKGSLGELETALKKLKDIQQNNTEIGSAEYQKLGSQIDETTKKIKELKKVTSEQPKLDYKNVGKDVDLTMMSLVGLRQELRLTSQAMEAAGKAGDKAEFERLKARFTEVRDAAKAFMEETIPLEDHMRTLASAGALAVSMGQNLALVLGADSKSAEELFKVFAKVQAITNLINGFSQIMDLAGKLPSAIRTVTVATEGLTLASIAQGIATKANTVAQWLLNAAMMANPIGLVIAGITALVGAIWYLVEAETAAEQAQNKVNAASVEYLKHQSKAYELERELSELRGDSIGQQKQYEIGQLRVNMALAKYNFLLDQSDENLQAWKDSMAEVQKFFAKSEGERKKIAEEMLTGTINNIAKIADAENKANKESESDRKKRLKREEQDRIRAMGNIEQQALIHQENMLTIEQNYFKTNMEVRAENDEQEMEMLTQKYQNGEILLAEYYAKVKQLNDKAYNEEKALEQKKMKLIQDRVGYAVEITSGLSKVVEEIMQGELEDAEDNEAKKKAIKKKYANSYFAIQAAEISSSTAAAIIKALADPAYTGPVAIAMSLTYGLIGAMQIANANAARQRMLKANRGAIVPGLGNSDTVPAMLTPGEGIVNNRAMAIPSIRNSVIEFNKIGNGESSSMPLTQSDVVKIAAMTVRAIPVVNNVKDVELLQNQTKRTQQSAYISM